MQPKPLRSLAYYCTDWIWRPTYNDSMKSLLLFFDGIEHYSELAQLSR
jgi:hypothetical protein